MCFKSSNETEPDYHTRSFQSINTNKRNVITEKIGKNYWCILYNVQKNIKANSMTKTLAAAESAVAQRVEYTETELAG